MRRTLLLLSAASVLATSGHAQNSQYLTAPQQFSPAMTGFTSADVRASYNHYFLQPSYAPNHQHYQVGLLSVDAPLLRGKLPKGDALGMGMYHTFYTGNGRPLDNNFCLSAAYHKGLGAKRDHYISAGVQGLQRVIKTSEGWERGRYLYNPGVMYTRRLADKATVYASLSAFVDPRFPGTEPMVSVGGTWAVSRRVSLSGNALLFPGSWGYDNYLVTANAGYVLNKKSKVPTTLYAGGTMRYDDYFAPYIGVERWGLRLGITREYNISPSDPIWGGDGYEVSLLWLGRFKKHSEKLKDVRSLPRIY